MGGACTRVAQGIEVHMNRGSYYPAHIYIYMCVCVFFARACVSPSSDHELGIPTGVSVTPQRLYTDGLFVAAVGALSSQAYITRRLDIIWVRPQLSAYIKQGR
jgi:hypothetical protein